MKFAAFSGRVTKEILRAPVPLSFGLGFPLVLLFLLSAIQANIPISLFEIKSLTPGITVFGLSFVTLFSAMLIAKDRESALTERLFTTPLTAADFIFGYAVPILPLSLAQCIICYIAAAALGLKLTVTVIWAFVFIISVAVFFISLGLLFGSMLTVKQVGGICGALVTNLTAWLSGVWFDLNLVGGAFKKIAYLLPFVHAVELERAVLNGDYGNIMPHIWWVAGYAAATLIAAVFMFLRRMKK